MKLLGLSSVLYHFFYPQDEEAGIRRELLRRKAFLDCLLFLYNFFKPQSDKRPRRELLRRMQFLDCLLFYIFL
jgi:hypothetical protein